MKTGYIASVVLATLSWSHVNSQSTCSGITVTGSGSKQSQPDIATINLGVSVTADSISQARDEAATSMAAIITSLTTNGIDQQDIQSSWLSIYPQYDYTSNGDSSINGYQVQNSITATIKDISQAGEIVDDAITAGGASTSVDGITFDISDKQSLMTDARKAAVADAKASAQTLADESGVTLGAPIAIVEVEYPSDGGLGSTQVSPASPSADQNQTTPVLGGTVSVTVQVTVTFAIGA